MNPGGGAGADPVPAGEPEAWQLAALSAPSLPLIALGFVLNSYLPEYYATRFGYSLGAIGLALTLVRLVDMAADPVIGGLMDRDPSRPNRFKAWHALGIPLIAGGAAMIFLPQVAMPMAWVVAGLLLLYLGQSVGLLSQFSIAALVSSSHAGRLRVYGWIQFGNMVGVILLLVLPPAIMRSAGLPEGDLAYGMGLTLIGLAPLAMGALLLVVREPRGLVARNASGFLDYFRLFRFPSVRNLVLADLFMGLSLGMVSALMVLFFTRLYGWTHPETAGLMLVQFVAGMVLTPAWQRIADRFGKRPTLVSVCLAIMAIQLAVLLVGYLGRPFAYVLFVLYGVFYSASQLLPRAMMADVADEVLLDTGSDLRGLLFAYLSGTYKCGIALSLGIGLGVLSLLGFDPSSPDNTPLALAGLRLASTVGPALLTLLCVLFVLRFPLSRQRHEGVMQRLRDGAADGAAKP